jgi:hypothetical protein
VRLTSSLGRVSDSSNYGGSDTFCPRRLIPPNTVNRTYKKPTVLHRASMKRRTFLARPCGGLVTAAERLAGRQSPPFSHHSVDILDRGCADRRNDLTFQYDEVTDRLQLTGVLAGAIICKSIDMKFVSDDAVNRIIVEGFHWMIRRVHRVRTTTSTGQRSLIKRRRIPFELPTRPRGREKCWICGRSYERTGRPRRQPDRCQQPYARYSGRPQRSI